MVSGFYHSKKHANQIVLNDSIISVVPLSIAEKGLISYKTVLYKIVIKMCALF